MVMIDMAALQRAAESPDTRNVVVSRRWLRAVHDLLSSMPPPGPAERDARIREAIDMATAKPIG